MRKRKKFPKIPKEVKSIALTVLFAIIVIGLVIGLIKITRLGVVGKAYMYKGSLVNLTHYPYPFIEDGQLNVEIVVGDGAPIEDNESADIIEDSLPCTDSDVTQEYPNGKNPYEKGTISKYRSTLSPHPDICLKDQHLALPGQENILLEGYCTQDGIGDRDGIDCLNGCQDGACIMVDVAPAWDPIPQDQNIIEGIPFYYDINASDDAAVDTYFINDTINFRIDPATGIIENNTILALGIYWLNISVNDTSNNINSSIISITVESAPLICTDSDGDNYNTTGAGCGPVDCDDTNDSINPGATEICDGVDNDCNAGTVDGSGEAPPLADKQDGVCTDSEKVCDGNNGWIEPDYTLILNYESTETSCSDSYDNDCDVDVDCDDADCVDDVACLACITNADCGAGEFCDNNVCVYSLVASYTFNDTVADSSINGNDGTINGDPQYTPDSIRGYALEFDGSGDYVDLGTEIDATLSSGYTISAWVKPRSSFHSIISTYDGAEKGLKVRIDDNAVNTLLYSGSTDFLSKESGTDTIPLDIWSHVVVTWDGTFTSQSFDIYINGTKVTTAGSVSGSINSFEDSSASAFIGAELGVWGIKSSFFDGTIDELKIYNHTLVLEEVQEIYNNEKPNGYPAATGGAVMAGFVNVVSDIANAFIRNINVVGLAILASDIITTISVQNVIAVGHPCNNSVVDLFLSDPTINMGCGNWPYSEGQAIIKLVQNNGNLTLIVAGTTVNDTKRAAMVLANYTKYIAEFTGDEVCVEGTNLVLADINVSAGACVMAVPPTCTDGDGDGYNITGAGCGPVDCDDDSAACGADCNPGITNEGTINCSDGYDNDCDGDIDCDDADCSADPDCIVPCVDGDGDGYNITGGACGPVDCNDTDININPGAIENCSNSIDDDCDGDIDCDDVDCSADPDCIICTDTDGGINYAVKGNVSGMWEDGSMASNQPDVCGEDILNEFYCEDSGILNTSVYTCPYGCQDGACLPGYEQFTIQLEPGWNLISIPLILENNSIEDVLADIRDNVTVVYTYDPEAEWSVWHPDPSIPSNLHTIELGRGYWIKMENSTTLTVEGVLFELTGWVPPPSFTLKQGWNMVGIYSLESRAMTTAFVDIKDKYTSLWTYNKTNEELVQLFKEAADDPDIEAGKGYWIYMAQEGDIFP
jgi:hypothetical protein